MIRHKIVNITEDKVYYFYYENDIKLFVDAVKGILAERDDPKNKDRYLAPVIHYMTDDCETTVWARAREFVNAFENNRKEIV